MRKKRQVIIGNGAAGLSAARALRRVDPSSAVTIISAESYPAYSPALLPYYLSGRIKESGMFIVDLEFYRRNGIEFMPGREATAVDAARQRVTFKDGSWLEYDNLLVASGGSPRRLNSHDGYMARVLTLRTINDARKILDTARNSREILVSGAGLAGLEVVHALNRAGRKITVMAKSRQILSRNTDPETAALIQKEIEKTGVKFLLGCDVTEIAPFKDKIRISTDNDERLNVDMVIVGKGVGANIQIVKDQVKTDRGILVDERMRTSIPNIYAAGDVAQAGSLLTGGHEVFANWPSACFEGEVAGLNMGGRDARLPGEVAYNILPVYGWSAAFMGDSMGSRPAIEVLRWSDEKNGRYRKLFLENNRLVGAVLFQEIADVGIILHLINRQADISPYKDKLASSPIRWGKVLHHLF